MFEVDIVSEHEPQYWGFETQEEWDRWLEEINRQGREKSYCEMIAYSEGKETTYRPGTNGFVSLEIAKRLINENPSLRSPDKKDELLGLVEKLSISEHCVTVQLDAKDMHLVKMIATHEDDLPQA